MSQLLLFEDTDCGCSVVARPLGTTADGLHRASSTSYSRDVAHEVKVQNETLATVTAGSVSDCFDGSTYEPVHDKVRLGRQASAVFELMKDVKWRSIGEICSVLKRVLGGASEAGVSARLRDFRKEKFGGHTVNRRRRGPEHWGVFEYQVDLQMTKTKSQFVEEFLNAFDTLCGLNFDPSELVSFSTNAHSIQAQFYQEAFLRAAESLGVTEFRNHESAPLHVYFNANGIDFVAIFKSLPDIPIVTTPEIASEQVCF